MDHITRRKILVRWGAHVSALSDSDCCFSFWLANWVDKKVNPHHTIAIYLRKRWYKNSLFLFLFQATIVRSQKDTAHTKAERNILEAVKVCSK